MKKKAFSLIELLISLITISVILASMAPIITHKMKHGGVSIGTKKLSMKCPSSVGSQCTLCLGNQCIACPIGCGNQFKNTLTCKCETCTVANCTNCTSGSNQCDTCKLGCTKISNNECKCCPSGQYIVGNTCTTCPKGYKCSNNAATKCSGTQYQNETGKDSCKECAGVVSSDRTSCSNCASGTYWHTTNKTCTTCPTGNKCIGDNQKTACAGNEYQDESGKDSCKSCLGVVNSTHNGCRSCSYFGSNCSTCTYDSCTSYNCSSGEYATSSGCSECSSKYGSACINCNLSICTNYNCTEGQYVNSSGTCSSCTDFGSSCTACNSNGCTDCKGFYFNNKCVKCEDFNAIYIEGKEQGVTYKFCIKKYNAGDEGGPSIAGIKTIEYSQNEPYCWTGRTAGEGCTELGQYNSCNRTVCNWYAADQICKNIGWSLMDWKQMRVLEYNTKKHEEELNFCNSYTGYTPYCPDNKDCKGTCRPSGIWTAMVNPTLWNYIDLLETNTFFKFSSASVRCVLTIP